jgi:hypothetical protein
MHFLLLAAQIHAQEGCESTNIGRCKGDAEIFRSSTCDPLMARNRTHYDHCLCYHFVNLGLCYLQCQSQAAIQEHQGQVIPQITAQCTAVQLNPRALPQPPIWQTFFQTSAQPSRPSTAAVSGSAAAPPAASSQPRANTAYQAIQTGFMVSLAILAGMML